MSDPEISGRVSFRLVAFTGCIEAKQSVAYRKESQAAKKKGLNEN